LHTGSSKNYPKADRVNFSFSTRSVRKAVFIGVYHFLTDLKSLALRLHLPVWGKETPRAMPGVEKVITSLGEDGNRIMWAL
jgi:hypothetical protein